MSTFFTVEEMRCKDKARTPYPVELVITEWPGLSEIADEIRYAWGGQLNVISGYRTPTYNARLSKKSTGVAKDSQHVLGRAMDIAPVNPTAERIKALWELTRSLWHQGKLEKMGGLGVYPGWIHIDTRPHAPGHLTQWYGKGFGSEK